MSLFIKNNGNRARVPSSCAMSVLHQICTECFDEFGFNAIITSGLDGTHSRKSEHYQGNALDWRIRHLDNVASATKIAEEMQIRLGYDFVVILESDHIHTHWEPSEAYNAD